MEIEMRSNWALLTNEQRSEWLCRFLLHCPTRQFDHNLLHDCMVALRDKRDLLVRNILSELAHTVYAGMTQEQIASASTRTEFYYTCMVQPPELIGKCIYWTVRGEEV